MNFGKGFFGVVDLNMGRFELIIFCFGFLWGLVFWKNWAIVGLFKFRDRIFLGLELDENLFVKDVKFCCGLMVIDINIGSIVEWLCLEGVIIELYDV